MPTRHTRLVVLSVAAVGAFFAADRICVESSERSDIREMRAARDLAQRWFRIIEDERKVRGIQSEISSRSSYRGLIGTEWSDITTTPGSLDAKITAANPEFAALMVRLLHDAGVDSSCTVGVALSGSFPSLAVATLAALQTIGARAVVASSVGASSFGANDVGATWLDMEAWLRKKGDLRYASVMVTPGGEDDTGGGLSEEGIEAIAAAARRTGTPLTIPANFDDALRRRIGLFAAQRIHIFVNIGGNQTSLGKCPHALSTSNGLVRQMESCKDSLRGLILRFAEQGVPLIHLLDIRSLSAQYGLPLVPPAFPGGELSVSRITVVHRPLVALLIALLGAGLWVLRTRVVPFI